MPDISITYNDAISNLFSYALSETSPKSKYDFISIVLRDIKAGLGFPVTNLPLSLGAVERGNVITSDFKTVYWQYYTPTDTGNSFHLYASGSEYVAPYKGTFNFSWNQDVHQAPPKIVDANNSTKQIGNNLSQVEHYCYNHCPDLYYLENGRTTGNKYILSLLRKDGTWQILAESSSATFSTESLNLSQYDIDLFARSSNGHLRARLDQISNGNVHFGYESKYSLCENYFSMSYLPQPVELHYIGVEYEKNIISPDDDEDDRIIVNPINVDLSKYTKYHRIALKDTEGASTVRINKNGSFLVLTNFQKGSFRLKDDGKTTLVTATAVNSNGSTISDAISYNLGTVVVPPVKPPYILQTKANGQSIQITPTETDDNIETDTLISYTISSVSELNQATLTGEFKDNNTVDVSSLRSDMYVINCLGASGNTYSFKFTK